MEEKLLLIGAGVLAATLLLTQARAIAEIISSILGAVLRFVYVVLCGICKLLQKIVEIFIDLILYLLGFGRNRNSADSELEDDDVSGDDLPEGRRRLR